MFRGKLGVSTALLTCVLLGGACVEKETQSSNVVPIIIGTGPLGAGFLSFAEALEPHLRARVRTLRLELRLSRGAVHNLAAVGRGDFDCAFTYADVAYEAAHRQSLDEGEIALENIGAIATVQLTPVQLVARAGSGIHAIRDLAGKRASMGLPGSATLLTAQALLRAYGIQGAVERVGVSPADIAAKPVAGDVDAVLALSFHSEALDQAIAGGAYLVPIEGPVVERLREQRPFLRPVTIPAGFYKTGQPAVTTIGVESLLVCRRSLSEAAALELTDGLLGALQALAPSGNWNLVPMEEVPATSIPLHPGAALYYRQAELMR